jgi:accessory gene regulator B
MVILSDVAAAVSQYLAQELRLDIKDRETVRFGVEFFLSTFLNVGVVIGVAWWLGATPYVVVALITCSSLRLISGGAHSSTYLRCLALGTVILVGIAKLAPMIGMVPQALLFALVAFTAGEGYFVVYKWVPADTPAKPIVSPVKKARYRRLSYIFIAVWAAVVNLWVLYGGDAPLVSALALASIGGIWWQLYSITPAGYRFINVVETLVDKCSVVFQARKSTI